MMKRESGVSPVIGVMLMIVVTLIIAAIVAALAGGLGSEKKAGPSVSLGYQLKYTDGISPPSPYVKLSITCTNSAGSTYVSKTSPYVGGLGTTINGVKVSGTPNVGLNKDGLIFTNNGGDAIDLKDLQMDVRASDLNTIVDYSSTKANVPFAGSSSSTYCSSGGTISAISGSNAWSGYTTTEIEQMMPSKYFYKISATGLDLDDTIIRPGDSFIWLVDNNGQYGAISGSSVTNTQIARDWGIKDTNGYGGSESFAIERGTDSSWELSDKPSGEVLAKGDFEFPNT